MALQGVQMPSIAGVYGVKDFREDLRPDGGLGKLANMAMNMYQFKSNQAQQKEMQDAAQQFQAAQADKNATNQAIAADVQRRWQSKEKAIDREAQRNLTEAKWAQDKAMMKDAAAKAEEAKQAEYSDYFDNLTGRADSVDLNNPDDIRRYKKELNEGIVRANRMKDQAGVEYLKEMDKSLDPTLTRLINTKQANADIKDMIQFGDKKNALAMIDKYEKEGYISKTDAAKYKVMAKRAGLQQAVNTSNQVNTLNKNNATAAIGSMLPAN